MWKVFHMWWKFMCGGEINMCENMCEKCEQKRCEEMGEMFEKNVWGKVQKNVCKKHVEKLCGKNMCKKCVRKTNMGYSWMSHQSEILVKEWLDRVDNEKSLVFFPSK